MTAALIRAGGADGDDIGGLADDAEDVGAKSSGLSKSVVTMVWFAVAPDAMR